MDKCRCLHVPVSQGCSFPLPLSVVTKLLLFKLSESKAVSPPFLCGTGAGPLASDMRRIEAVSTACAPPLSAPATSRPGIYVLATVTFLSTLVFSWVNWGADGGMGFIALRIGRAAPLVLTVSLVWTDFFLPALMSASDMGCLLLSPPALPLAAHTTRAWHKGMRCTDPINT